MTRQSTINRPRKNQPAVWLVYCENEDGEFDPINAYTDQEQAYADREALSKKGDWGESYHIVEVTLVTK